MHGDSRWVHPTYSRCYRTASPRNGLPFPLQLAGVSYAHNVEKNGEKAVIYHWIHHLEESVLARIAIPCRCYSSHCYFSTTYASAFKIYFVQWLTGKPAKVIRKL